MTKHQVYLGLGSNLGDRRQMICEAIRLIDERVGTVVSQSSLIETEPWGFASAHRFLNGVILVETLLSPREVLAATQQIERTLGKTARHATRRPSASLSPLPTSPSALSASFSPLPAARYADRPIDIDILLYDDLTVDEPDLKIPHPLMLERDFVMIPLREIQSK